MRARRSAILLALVLVVLALAGALGFVRVRSLRAPIAFEVPPGPSYRLALSDQGEWLAVATRGVGVKLWPIAGGASPLDVTNDASVVRQILFEPGRDSLALLDAFEARRFTWSSGVREAGVATVITGSESARLSPAGGEAADVDGGGSLGLRLWDTQTGKLARSIAAEANDTSGDDVDFSPSGALVSRQREPAIREGDEPDAGRLRVWSARDARLVADAPGIPADGLLRVVLDPGDRCLVQVPKSLELREVSTARTIRRFPGARDFARFFALAVTTDGELVALGNDPVEVRSLRTGELVASFAPSGVEGPCAALAFDRAGDRLAGVWKGRAFVWRVPR